MMRKSDEVNFDMMSSERVFENEIRERKEVVKSSEIKKKKLCPAQEST